MAITLAGKMCNVKRPRYTYEKNLAGWRDDDIADEFNDLRRAVYSRDNGTCRCCGKLGLGIGKLLGRPPLQTGEWRAVGLFAASGTDELRKALR